MATQIFPRAAITAALSGSGVTQAQLVTDLTAMGRSEIAGIVQQLKGLNSITDVATIIAARPSLQALAPAEADAIVRLLAIAAGGVAVDVS